MNKTCPACRESLDINFFGPSISRSDGLACYCKTCAREQVNASRARRRGRPSCNIGGTRAKHLTPAESRLTDEQVVEGRIMEALRARALGWNELKRKAETDGDMMSEILLMLTDEGSVLRRGKGDDRIYSLGGRNG
jgi:hypothetical protein